MTYCFLDIETTGLDPDVDEILEVAWRFTDDHFQNAGLGVSYLVEQRDWNRTWRQLNGNEFVHKMHADSGLLAELANDETTKHTLDEVYDLLTTDIRLLSVGGLIHMAGRSIHFDRDFLIANDFTPLFDDQQPVSFHHRVLDLSSVSMMLTSSGVDTTPLQTVVAKPHRALEDVNGDIEYARNIRGFINLFTTEGISL